MTDKPTLLEAALEAYGTAPIDTMASAQHNQEVFMQAAIDTIRAHLTALAADERVTDAMHEASNLSGRAKGQTISDPLQEALTAALAKLKEISA